MRRLAATIVALLLLAGPAFAQAVQPAANAAGQIFGTATNDSAAAGNVGEFVSSTVIAGSAISLTTSTPVNVTSISLTAGDWDVWGVIAYQPAGTTTVTSLIGSIVTTTGIAGTFGAANQSVAQVNYPATVIGNTVDTIFDVAPIRMSLSVTTTVFLTSNQVFGTSTLKAYGGIYARRLR